MHRFVLLTLIATSVAWLATAPGTVQGLSQLVAGLLVFAASQHLRYRSLGLKPGDRIRGLLSPATVFLAATSASLALICARGGALAGLQLAPAEFLASAAFLGSVTTGALSGPLFLMRALLELEPGPGSPRMLASVRRLKTPPSSSNPNGQYPVLPQGSPTGERGGRG